MLFYSNHGKLNLKLSKIKDQRSKIKEQKHIVLIKEKEKE